MSGRRIGLKIFVSTALICAAGGVLAVVLAAGSEPESASRTALAASSPASTSGKPAMSGATERAAAAVSVEVEDATFADGATLTIHGVVRDETGRGIPEASVTARNPRDFRERHTAESGPRGAYELTGLDPSRPWSLSASADGYRGGGTAEAVVATPNHLDLEYDFALVRPQPQSGAIEIVTTDATGAAVHHTALVRRLRDADDDGGSAGTQGLAPGRYRVTVLAKGRAPAVREVDVGAGTTRLDLGQGEEESAIEGMLLASDLTPMRGFKVYARDPDIPRWHGWNVSKTAADGTFRITGLRKIAYTLAVDAEDFALDGAAGVTAPAQGVRVVVRDDARVTWHLVYPDGPGVDRSAEVDVALKRDGGGLRLTTHWKGDDGSATVPGFDEITLEFRVQGCAPLVRAVRVRPGETSDLGTLAPEPAFEVWGRVADAAGKPIVHASVVARVADTKAGGYFRQDATFLVRGLPRGDGIVTVGAPGYASTRVPFRCGQDEPVLVTLIAGGRLVVRGAAPNTIVVAHGAADAVCDVTTDDFGEASMQLEAGRWRIEASDRESVDVDIREGATTSVRFGGVSR